MAEVVVEGKVMSRRDQLLMTGAFVICSLGGGLSGFLAFVAYITPYRWPFPAYALWLSIALLVVGIVGVVVTRRRRLVVLVTEQERGDLRVSLAGETRKVGRIEFGALTVMGSSSRVEMRAVLYDERGERWFALGELRNVLLGSPDWPGLRDEDRDDVDYVTVGAPLVIDLVSELSPSEIL